MNLGTAVALMVVTSLSLPAMASNKKDNNFTLVSNTSGKSAGKASYSIKQSSKGAALQGDFQFDIDSKQQGQYNFSYKVDDTGNLQSASVQNVTAQKTLNFEPTRKRSEIETVTIIPGAASMPTAMPLPKPDVLFACDGDPSAIQILMNAVQNHSNPNSVYLLMVPPGPFDPQTHFIYVKVQPSDGAKGTFNGKGVALKGYILYFQKSQGQAYVDDTGSLMEADLPEFGLNYIRQNFSLSASTH